jgi:diguanylate cyclase (GGDEF)-like protein
MAISLSVWYFRLLDITPIAYNVLFRNMLEGVVVLDMKNRVIEMNPIALNLFELSASEVLGQDAGNVFSGWGAVVSAIHSDQTNFEAVVAEKTLDFRVSPLFGRRQQQVGTLLVWRDITELKNAQLMLERLASVDELTGAMNRRSFMEKAKLETVRVKRANSPLSILIMDIDYFKKINDTHGHGTGDEALIHFSQICRRAIRPYDFFARIGGEEFAILLPEVDAHTAFDVAERLRFLVAQQPVKVGDMNIPITASFGIADLMGTDDDLGQVIRRADIALYCSKRSGRNQTQIWRESLEANSS